MKLGWNLTNSQKLRSLACALDNNERDYSINDGTEVQDFLRDLANILEEGDGDKTT